MQAPIFSTSDRSSERPDFIFYMFIRQRPHAAEETWPVRRPGKGAAVLNIQRPLRFRRSQRAAGPGERSGTYHRGTRPHTPAKQQRAGRSHSAPLERIGKRAGLPGGREHTVWRDAINTSPKSSGDSPRKRSAHKGKPLSLRLAPHSFLYAGSVTAVAECAVLLSLMGGKGGRCPQPSLPLHHPAAMLLTQQFGTSPK